MTTFKNSIIINHRVLHPESVGAPARYTYTSSSVRGYLDYTTRSGRHRTKGGCDERITEADLALERAKPSLNNLHTALEYGAREGRFAERGVDDPIMPGEVSGGIWDAQGVRELADVEREIMVSGSNVVQSVLAVSREWAEPLRMDTKEAWQSLMRGHWEDFMEAWGVIPRECCKWVAEYHVDAAMSLHVHVMSWDSSGKHFTGPRNIPHAEIERSKQVIRKEIMRHLSLERSLEKDYVRQASLTLARAALGREPTPQEMIEVRLKARKACVEFTPSPFSGDRAALDARLRRVIETLPASGMGRRGLSLQDPETKVQALFAVDALKTDPEIGHLAGRWKELVERGADILGLEGEERERYVEREVRDLDTRLANVVLERAVQENRPWERSAILASMRKDAIRAALDSTPLERRLELWRDKDRDGMQAEAARALTAAAVADRCRAYRESVLAFVRENEGKALLKRQEERVLERADRDILSSLSWRLSMEPHEREVSWRFSEIARGPAPGARNAAREAATEMKRSPIALSKTDERIIASCVERMAERIAHGARREELRSLASPAITAIAEKPELASALERTWSENRLTLGEGGKARLRETQRKIIFEELYRAARAKADEQEKAMRCVREAEREEKRESSIADDVVRAVRRAQRSRMLDEAVQHELTVRIRYRDALADRSH